MSSSTTCSSSFAFSFKENPKSKVACEADTKDNMVMVAGEIATQANVDDDGVVRKVAVGIGFTSYVDYTSKVDSMGILNETVKSGYASTS